MQDYDLYSELQSKTKLLDTSLKLLRRTGTELAAAEREYKVLLRQECLKLRDAKMPVSMISLTCYGIPEVAEARFQRDVALTTYEANKEAINMYKLQMRLIEEQIKREWGSQ